jgi:hypothetical protein
MPEESSKQLQRLFRQFQAQELAQYIHTILGTKESNLQHLGHKQELVIQI